MLLFASVGGQVPQNHAPAQYAPYLIVLDVSVYNWNSSGVSSSALRRRLYRSTGMQIEATTVCPVGPPRSCKLLRGNGGRSEKGLRAI